MSEEDQMSPDTSPGEVTKKTGVRRVNNLPVYIIGGLMATFLLVMVLVAADRSEKQSQPVAKKDEKAGNTTMFANEITANQNGGMIQAERVAPPAVPDLSQPQSGKTIDVARPNNLDVPPKPPKSANLNGDRANNDELQRIHTTKLQQFEEAVKAKTGVKDFAPRSSGSTPDRLTDGAASITKDEALARLAAVRQQIDAQTRDDPTAAYKARLQQLQAGGVGGTPGGAGSSAPRLVQTAGSSSSGKDYSQFAKTGQDDRWKLDSKPEAPGKPYELRAGFVIPGMLISGINSDLPGQIIGQVSQDVYDTAIGKWKLIPQGSRLVGRYSSDVAYGQSRILIAWQRIVFPDGKAMDIGSMPGSDSAGYSGFTDQVNNHYLRLFASAFLTSAVTAGISLTQNQNQGQGQQNFGTQQTASGALSEALGQQLGQVTAQLISKNINTAPGLEIRPGYRFNVVVIKDMTFSKPYQAFDY